jgi:hypothetical protein
MVVRRERRGVRVLGRGVPRQPAADQPKLHRPATGLTLLSRALYYGGAKRLLSYSTFEAFICRIWTFPERSMVY